MTEQEIAQKPVSFQDFSSMVKAKYPDYKDIDDLTLAQKMVEKYPEYKDHVLFEQPQTIQYNGERFATPEMYQQSQQHLEGQQSKFTPEDIAEAKSMIPVIQGIKKSAFELTTKIPNRFLPNNPELEKLYPKPKEELGYSEPEVLGQSRQQYVANDLLDKTEGYYKAIADGDSNAASRFVNGLKTIDLSNLVTVGIKGMAEDIDIYGAAKRYSENKATPDDKNLLMAKAMLDEVQSKAQNDRATSIGTGLADMAPWLAQFALSGGIGSTVTIATEKALGSMMAKNMMGKVTGKLLTGITSTAAQTAVQVPMMVSGTAQRMTDQYQLQDGNLVKSKEGQGFGEALGRTYANNFLETYSERVVGDAVDKLGTIGLSKVLDSKMLAGTKVKDIINAVRSNKYVKLTNTTLGLNTPLTENIEEAFTGLTQPLVTEKNLDDATKQIKEYFTKENLVRTFLTTAAMGAGAGVLQAPGQVYHNVKSDKGGKIVRSFDETQSGLWNQALSAETIEERKDAWLKLWNYNAENGSSDGDMNSLMHYYQTALSDNELKNPTPADDSNSEQPSDPVSSDTTPQFTVDPRQTKEAEIRQYADEIKSKKSGKIQEVEIITPRETDNTPGLVVGSFVGKDGKTIYRVKDKNKPNIFYNVSELEVTQPKEISVDEFVNNQLGVYDQTEQKKQRAANNQMIDSQGRLLTRTNDPNSITDDGEFWLDENEQGIEVPNEDIAAWEQAKQSNPEPEANVISERYGNATITGIKDETGNILVSEPANIDQANALKEQVEQSTGGNATVQADLIPNEDATAPQQFKLSVIPVQANTINTSGKTSERKITTQPIGKDQIDFVEGEDFDEVVATDKMPLEKALPILEKKFKDHPKVVVVAEKVQVEVPGKVIKGETKWDDDVVEPSTTKTVVKSIKIVPKASEIANNSEQQIEKVTENKTQNTDNPFDALFENTNSSQNNKTSNEFSFNRFRTTPTVKEMQSKIDELQSIAPSAAPVILVQSVDALPAAIRNHSLFSLGIYGVWYNDKVYVMTNKIKSIDHLVELWIHENGVHNGLRNILPTNERNLLMVQVYDSFRKIAEIKPEIKELFDWVNREYAGSTKQVIGEELLANLSEKIVSREDLNPEVKSIWNETIKYLRALLSKLYNFNGSLLTEGQLIEIIHVSVQSNFQKNEHSSSSQRGSGSLRKGEQRNVNGSEGNPNDGREYQNQTDGRIQAEDRSGRVLDRNGTISANEEDSRLNTPESNQELDSTDSRVNFKKGQVPLSSLLEAASGRVKQKRMPQKVRTKTDRFVSRFINGNTAIKILLEKFDLKVPDYANIFLAVNQKSSRQMGQKTHFEKKLYNPMLRSVEKIMAILEKKGLKKEEAYKKVEEYMISRHAPERNGWFRSQGKKGNNFSGMTDEQAIAIYEKFESEIPRELIDELWTNTRECTEKISRYWVEYGKYTQSSLDAVMARNWKYYVPLRGFEPIAEEIQLDYEKSEKRSEFSGDEKTEGRESMADDPIAYIYQMATSAIMWGEKNRAKRSAYNLIKLNSSRKDLFEMSQMNYMTDQLGMVTEVVYETSGTYKDPKGNDKPDHKVFLMNTDEDGNTKKTELGFRSVLEGSGYTFSSSRISNPMSEKPSYLRKQHEVDVYVDGNRFKMIFKDPAISNAINGDNYSQAINFKYLPIASITRFMSRSVTSWRPSFITSNTYRDFKTGAKTMFIQRGFKDSLKFQAKYTVAARFLASNMLNDAWRNSSKIGDKMLDIIGVEPKTEEEKKWKKLYDEYNLNGGPTGQAYLMPLDEVKSKVERYIRHIKRSGSSSLARLANPLNALRLMEGLAGYGESIARFTAYTMARERGESIIMSINEAKEITTNFDTRGEYSATIGSFIMFFNASTQGAAKQYDLAKNHTFRYFAINAVSLVIQGLLSRYLWDLLNGDDDDKDYAEINKYTMYNNTVIGWKDNYVSIPLAQGYRVWNALGVAMYEHHTGRLSTEQMSFDMAEVFTQALSPVEISGIFNKQGKLSAPKVAGSLFSAIKPLMDISTNEDFGKRPIFYEPFLKSQQGKSADSQMHFNNTNAMIVSFTNWLYKQGGGDPELGTKTIKGKRILEKYDWNPAKIEYILKSYTGGPGQTVLDVANYMILKTVDDLDKQIKDKEHKIEGFDPTSIPILQTYYHKKYTGFMYNEYREVANKAEELKFEDDRRNQTNDPNRIPEISDNQREFLIDYEMTNDEIKSLLDLKKTITDEDENTVIDLQILGLRRGFVSKYKYFGKQ